MLVICGTKFGFKMNWRATELLLLAEPNFIIGSRV